MIKIGSMALKFLPKGDTERLTYDKLQEDANTDGLTKCYNKMYFNNKLDLEVKKSKVTGNPLSLVIFDLDHFKHLNDNYGHDAGDYVLAEKADLLRDNGIRKGDTFARYGGEEFVVLLPNTNLKQAFEIAERLRKLVETHEFIYDGKKLPVTASIGVADYRQGVNTGTDLFKRADSAVYKSKDAGRNQVNFYKG
jgi:diguanylate cyclase (GGDEF)-like protein